MVLYVYWPSVTKFLGLEFDFTNNIERKEKYSRGTESSERTGDVGFEPGSGLYLYHI